MKSSIKDFFSKWDQIRRKLREIYIFGAVNSVENEAEILLFGRFTKQSNSSNGKQTVINKDINTLMFLSET